MKTSCVFCGRREPAQHKLVPRSYVQALLDRQGEAGVSEAVVELMQDELRAAAVADSAAGTAERTAAQEPQSLACMCCYYWVERRRALRVAPLPMQKLLWFVRTLSWCEAVVDSRVLQRLVEVAVEPDNVFSRLFAESELSGLRDIAAELRAARKKQASAPRVQGEERFFVKRALARLWRAQNGDGLCLPHAAAADWLR